MSWNMVTDDETKHLPGSEQMLAYADAYLSAAHILCEKMSDNHQTCNWPNSSVVLMLSAHAVELFIKGTLLAHNPDTNISDYGHDIEKLEKDYLLTFPEPEFEWNIPFKMQIPENLIASQIKELRQQFPQSSIVYRYPIGKFNKEWRGIYAFEPNSFKSLLAQVTDDFSRIRKLLGH